ncbi:MAG: TonB-dependent receptor [Bryobacteraceae bacterium]
MNKLLSLSLFVSLPLWAVVYSGRVLDESGGAVAGARVVLMGPVGSVAHTTTDAQGSFRLEAAPPARANLIVTAPGFARRQVPAREGPLEIKLPIAAIADTITVTASGIETPVTEQGASITIIPRTEIERRNEAFAAELLRVVPGVAVSQTGQRGGTTSLFVRGGESKYNLVLVDGVPIVDMRLGGFVDFAHLPTDHLDRIEVLRGAQSAVYGPYANSSVVNFVTRLEESPLRFDVLAEGGSFSTRRFAAGAAGSTRGFRGAVNLSRLDTGGEVANAGYRNENVAINLGKRFGGQDLSFRGSFNASENGVPGPYGSNPAGNFTGLDRVSRNKNNFSTYLLHYALDASPRLRQELTGSFFLNNNAYTSRFGGSFNKDLRGAAEARTTFHVNDRYTAAFGLAWSREEVKNTFIADNSFRNFPLRRDHVGLYISNRVRVGERLFLDLGLRTETIQTPLIPSSASSGRPELAARNTARVNPRASAAWRLSSSTRLHGSFGLGFRPPGGFELAFTNNPALKPERTLSFDVGIEQHLGRLLSFDATYFYNRYYDLIVSLGGSLSRLGSYTTDNLANSRAHGSEFSVHFRPSSALSVSGHYTRLGAEVLSLDGASGIAQQYYRVGQELPRRPRNSGAVNASMVHKRVSGGLVACFRGEVLDVEPSFGAFSGFFRNPGYTNLNIYLNYSVARGVTLYGNLRNALNRRYEEVFGYPSPRLNFVAGVKWRLGRE